MRDLSVFEIFNLQIKAVERLQLSTIIKKCTYVNRSARSDLLMFWKMLFNRSDDNTNKNNDRLKVEHLQL